MTKESNRLGFCWQARPPLKLGKSFLSRRKVLLGGLASIGITSSGCQNTNFGDAQGGGNGGRAAVARVEPISLSPLARDYGIEPISYLSRRDGQHVLPTVYMSAVPPEFHRQVVSFRQRYPIGTILISNESRHLFYVLSREHAIRYGVSVGMEGLTWSGSGYIYRRAAWPTWTPTPGMIERDPTLRRFSAGMPGGNTNPLGARALYLMSDGIDQGYRIHGTPNWRSIGQYASSGCIRMINQDVIDLYMRVAVGTLVLAI